jgi:hypothetical protein
MPSAAVGDIPSPAAEHHPAPAVGVWPIGALVAVHRVARHSGPQPDDVAVMARTA